MLVLTRKPAETIRIGDSVVIKVIKTGRGTVKLGIDAPQDVRVLRGELVVEAKTWTHSDVGEPTIRRPGKAMRLPPLMLRAVFQGLSRRPRKSTISDSCANLCSMTCSRSETASLASC